MSYYRREPQVPGGCIFLWLLWVALIMGFWGLVAWALWTYIQTH